MGPTFSEVAKYLSHTHWTLLTGPYARVAMAHVRTGDVDCLCILGGDTFFRLSRKDV